MPKIKTAALATMLVLLTGTVMADPAPIVTTTPPNACPTGEFDANYPGIPTQCVKCAAPGCPSCHNERTQTTVAATDAAERNCPPVKPH